MKDHLLSYLFFTFLKLGATAFGGYMSLVAIVQKQVVEIDKRLKEEDLLDAVSLTAMLPGPMAVNVIAYVGYRLRGIPGALLATLGIILPSLLLVIGLSWGYFKYGHIPAVKNIFMGITPAVTALIVSVSAGMARKGMDSTAQWVIGILSALSLIFIGGFACTFCLIVASGIAGYFLFRDSTRGEMNAGGDKINKKLLIRSGSLLILSLCALIWGGQAQGVPLYAQVLSTFSGISLTLFGGGYVVIPALHELFVDNLGWLSSAELADGIAIGQITPGPIFITAAFIGYKVSGISGALLATIGMFGPPALLTVFLSQLVEWINRSTALKAAMKGIRTAVIGIIFASGVTIGQTIDWSVISSILFISVLFMSYKYNVSPVFLILGSGIAGFLFFKSI